MVYTIEFYAFYLKYKYIFFFILNEGRIRIFFQAEQDPDPWKKMLDPHPWKKYWSYSDSDGGKYRYRLKIRIQIQRLQVTTYGDPNAAL